MFEKIGREIVSGGIFERFPELKPYVGDNYGESNKHKKLLVIAESNYFCELFAEKSVFKCARMWYEKGEKESLITPEMESLVNNDGKIIYLKGLYRVIKTLLNLNTDKYDDVAFYNYFLRPALNNGKGKDKGFKGVYEDIDGKVSFAAFCGILEAIKPDIVIFASNFAWKNMQYFKKTTNKEFENVVIEKVSHPSCAWWNRYKGVYGRQKFENLLKEHWVK